MKRWRQFLGEAYIKLIGIRRKNGFFGGKFFTQLSLGNGQSCNLYRVKYINHDLASICNLMRFYLGGWNEFNF